MGEVQLYVFEIYQIFSNWNGEYLIFRDRETKLLSFQIACPKLYN